MDQLLIVIIFTFIGSLLTFFSGFGLGTLLLPVMALFFPLPLAIAITAVVHLMNNIFKFIFLRQKINGHVFFRFGLPSLLASFLGALALKELQIDLDLYTYTFLGKARTVTLFNSVMALLILFFAILEIAPQKIERFLEKINLTFGGILSGFFGGFSGHQGALRSAFLLRYKLPKEEFIATGMAIALLVDLARIPTYIASLEFNFLLSEWKLILVALISSLFAVVTGNKLLKKITVSFLKIFISFFLFLFALLIGGGFLN